MLYKLDYPFENKDAESMYAWSIHYGVVQNVYGQQKYCTDFSEAGYPNIIYNEEKDKYEGVYVEDALEYVIECKNMQEDRISYDSALKLYLYDDLNEKSE